MKKPDNFLQSVWDKLNDAEKKEVYLNSIIFSDEAPAYLAGLIESAEISIDLKIIIAEKIINGERLTTYEKNIIKIDTAD